jgi:hypothetical protein
MKRLEEDARAASSEAALLEAKTEVLGAQREAVLQEMAFYKAGDKGNSLRCTLSY